ncbi:type II toxin-antitoxin system VapB family antitoxin [Luteimicrobium subarcticum]|uniref:Antitoxin VapB n=1 Tax=Luteimicrobium subarcticum TaxID=620910 RepID=A0A2M8WW95_9MICO|nr:type II toxin-antitoxin system VapB family antitoxin [Luteimicrobium subarcticum]PJI95183.1 antitoxin VapB [Luteimicrobium subarcticum]
MVTTTVFRSNRTQAVRLPKDVALPDDVREVEIVAVGEARVIVPAGRGWDYWFAHGVEVTADFMDRDQPEPQERGW